MQAGALTVCAVAVVDKAADDCDGGGHNLLRQQQDAAIAREDAMAGNAAEQYPKIDPRWRRLVRPDRDGGKADIVGVLQDGKAPPAVEGDVEFARQAVEFAVVQ